MRLLGGLLLALKVWLASRLSRAEEAEQRCVGAVLEDVYAELATLIAGAHRAMMATGASKKDIKMKGMVRPAKSCQKTLVISVGYLGQGGVVKLLIVSIRSHCCLSAAGLE
jgi:hypothetical protein